MNITEYQEFLDNRFPCVDSVFDLAKPLQNEFDLKQSTTLEIVLVWWKDRHGIKVK